MLCARSSLLDKLCRGRGKGCAVRVGHECRIHGAGGGAPSGSAHPNYKHDLRTKKMQELRRLVSILGKEPREVGTEIK